MQRHAKDLQTKSRTHQVLPHRNGTFKVYSGTSGEAHIVRALTPNWFGCDCEWSKYHKYEDCSHTLAVREFLANAAGNTLSFWHTEEDANRQHRHTENLGFGLWSTERKPRQSPRKAQYVVGHGLDVVVSQEGHGELKHHITQHATTYTELEYENSAVYCFRKGNWLMFVKKEDVRIV